MRSLPHWLLFATAVAAWGVAMAYSQSTGLVLVLAGWLFFAVTITVAVLDLIQNVVPFGSPRAIAWGLAILTAFFVPSISLSGVSGNQDSLLMLPAVGGTVLGLFGTPWLCSMGAQPSFRAGRLSPMLLAWLGVVLNFAATMG